MKRFIALVLLTCATVSLHATTPAFDHPGALPILLTTDKVSKELKLDSLQRAVLNSQRDEFKAEARKLTNPLPKDPAARTAAEKNLIKLTERYNKRSLSVLSASQRVALVELEHRVLGGTMLVSPRVQSKLGLSEDQKKQIEALRLKGVAYVGKVNNQFEEGKIGYHERLTLLRARRADQANLMLKVLTPAQKETFLALGGKKIST